MEKEDKCPSPPKRLQFPGRGLRADGVEFTCNSTDISGDGVLVTADVRPETGETVVIYFQQLGRVQGQVVGVRPAGFALRFTHTQRKREELEGIACASPAYLAEQGAPQSLDDIPRHRLIGDVMAEGAAYPRWYFSKNGITRSIAIASVMSVDDMSAVADAAAGGWHRFPHRLHCRRSHQRGSPTGGPRRPHIRRAAYLYGLSAPKTRATACTSPARFHQAFAATDAVVGANRS